MKEEIKQSPMYIQYGCGLCAPEDWTNFDSSPRLLFERLPVIAQAMDLLGKRLFPPNVRYGDVVAGLPVKDGSVDAIYASHVLEHLAREDAVNAVRNTHRALRPGGVFRMIVPDLEWRARRYEDDHRAGDEKAADTFISSCLIGDTDRPRGALGVLRLAFGNSRHRWMYDERAMRQLLTEAGFVKIRRCDYNDSLDPMFSRVEALDRFYDGGERELAMEAWKL